MGRRYIPPDAKRLILHMASKPGVKRADIARLTDVHPNTITKLRGVFRETGDVVRRPAVVGRKRKLTGLQVSFVVGCIERRPDITLQELQDDLLQECNIDVSIATISRTLKRRGITQKKVTRVAAERDEEDRARFKMIVAEHYRPDQLVFVDESACDRRTLRRTHGWAIEGSPSFKREHFIRGKRYSILPALSLDGIIFLDVLERPVTASAFNVFIEGLLHCMNPWPLPNSVVVMDNASIHKSDGLREMIEARGMRLLYLPAYSPDLNPIEEAFSSIKAWLRANNTDALHEFAGQDESNPYRILWDAVFSVTAEKAQEWYHDSGYV